MIDSTNEEGEVTRGFMHNDAVPLLGAGSFGDAEAAKARAKGSVDTFSMVY